MNTTLSITLETIHSAPFFAAMDLADMLASTLDVKAARKGRAATCEEKNLRTLLITAMHEAEIDTIKGGSYTFTIDPEIVRLTAEDGSEIDAEMVGAITVHRAKKTTTKAAQRGSNRPVSMRASMTAALNDDAPLSGVVARAA